MRSDAERALRAHGHGPPVGLQAPRRARGRLARHHGVAGTREAPLPQPGAHQRDLGAVDRPVRPRPGPRPGGPQTSPGGSPHDSDWSPGSSMTLHQWDLEIADPGQLVLEADPYRRLGTPGTRSHRNGKRKRPSGSASPRSSSSASPPSRAPRSPSTSTTSGSSSSSRSSTTASSPEATSWRPSAKGGRTSSPTSRRCSRPATLWPGAMLRPLLRLTM